MGKSLVAGAVVILLAGRFKGQKAVFLKQLASGLCLITGPYKVNGIPLRRVPQSYVIGTSTVVDVSGAAIPDEVNDSMFKKPKPAKRRLMPLLSSPLTVSHSSVNTSAPSSPSRTASTHTKCLSKRWIYILKCAIA